MNYANTKRILFLLSVAPMSTAFAESAHDAHEAAAEPNIRSAEFRDIRKHLTGRWVGEYTNGTLEDPAEWNPVEVRYLSNGNGSAIIETYYYGDSESPGMSTIYYPNGADLQLTHYCGAQNHPRMKSVSYDEDTRTYAFRFLDITNLHDKADYHSKSLDLTFVTNDNILIQYSGDVRGRTAVQTYNLKRSSAD